MLTLGLIVSKRIARVLKRLNISGEAAMGRLFALVADDEDGFSRYSPNKNKDTREDNDLTLTVLAENRGMHFQSALRSGS